MQIYTVNPTYTSLIARCKYMPYYKQSVHLLAALAIANRYFNHSESIPQYYKNNNLHTWIDIKVAIDRNKIKV